MPFREAVLRACADSSKLKDARQLRCVFQDTEPPPESLPFFTEEHKSLGINSMSAIHKSYAESCKHRKNKGPSLGKIQVKDPHQRDSYAKTFEDRFQEENERQERCARGDAWILAKNILKLKEKDKAIFLHLPSAIRKQTRGKRIR